VREFLERDGRAIPYEIRKGVWVVFRSPTDYQKTVSKNTCSAPIRPGRYSVMYKRWHLIGLEVGISVASVGLRKEPTGCPIGSTPTSSPPPARLKVGEILDGEGGYTVAGKLFSAGKSTASQPAARPGAQRKAS